MLGLFAAVNRLVAVAVAIDHQQQLGLDLTETVHHAGRTHVGRAAGPNRADAGAGQQRHRRFRHIGQVGGHAVARPHTHASHGRCHRTHLGPQFVPAQDPVGGRLRAGNDGRSLAIVQVPAQRLFGVIQARARKPAPGWHLAVVQHRLHRVPGRQVEVAPDRGPEVFEVLDRPAPEFGIGVDLQALIGVQPVHVVAQTALRDALLGRGPKGRSHGLYDASVGCPLRSISPHDPSRDCFIRSDRAPRCREGAGPRAPDCAAWTLAEARAEYCKMANLSKMNHVASTSRRASVMRSALSRWP